MIPMTSRRDDEVEDVEDEYEDASDKTVAPQEVQGDRPLQLEEPIEDRAEIARTFQKVFIFIFRNFYFNLRTVWVPRFGTYDILILLK